MANHVDVIKYATALAMGGATVMLPVDLIPAGVEPQTIADERITHWRGRAGEVVVELSEAGALLRRSQPFGPREGHKTT
jgi:hypothetical protein